jgi:hypothetical protein
MAATQEEALARRQADAQRLAAVRMAETQEEEMARRQAASQRQAAVRMAATQEEAIARSQADAQRLAAVRMAETQEERMARQQAASQRQAAVRMAETQEEAMARRQENSLRQSNRRQFQNSNAYQTLLRRYQQASVQNRRLQPAHRVQVLVPRRHFPVEMMQEIPPVIDNDGGELEEYRDFFEANQEALEALSQRVHERDDRRSQQRAARLGANGLQRPRIFNQDERELARRQDAQINDLVRRLTPPEILVQQQQLREQLANVRAEMAQVHVRAGHPKYRVACSKTLAEFNETLHHDHYLGRLDNICGHCGAFYFKTEATTKKQYTVCCSNGQVRLPPFPGAPANGEESSSWYWGT